MGERRSTAEGTCGLWGASAVVAVMALTLAGPAAAQDPLSVQGPLVAQASAAGQQTITFDIAEQDLNAALLLFADRTGLQLVYDIGLVEGLRSASLNGSFMPSDALARLLAGTGIAFRVGEDDTVTLEPIAARQDDGTLRLGPVMVEGQDVYGTAQIGNLPPAYPGGQVASGTSIGFLGNRDIFDTPFATVGYTKEQIDRRQAKTIRDVLISNPAIRVQTFQGDANEAITIRGFRTDQVSTFDGFGGLIFGRRTPIAGAERVEAILGPSSFFTGAAAAASPIGSINIVPKRAGDESVTEIKGSFLSASNFGGALDVGRRFGDADRFGIRFNVERRDGDLGFGDASNENTNALLALDYTGDRFRLQSNLSFVQDNFEKQRPFIGISPGFPFPAVPDPDNVYALDGDFDEYTQYLGTIRAELDLTESLTLLAGYGRAHIDYEFLGPLYNIDNAAGDLSSFGVDRFDFVSEDRNQTGQIGLRGDLETGVLSHRLSVRAEIIERETFTETVGQGTGISSNLFNPTTPAFSPVEQPRSPSFDQTQTFYGVSFADTISVFDDRIQLTLGGRFQEFEIETRDPATGRTQTKVTQNALSPGFAILVKPTEQLSLYANYVEGLETGGTAPIGAVNAGQVLDPIQTEQIEFGAKYDFGNFGTSIAFYQIERASEFLDAATNVFGQFGEQRNRGIEWQFFGEPIEGLRAIGGIAFIDAELTEAADPATVGADAIAVANLQANLEIEKDIQAVDGLAVFGRMIYTGEAPQTLDRVQTVDSWFRFDAGFNWELDVEQQETFLRFQVDNLFDNEYFIARTDGVTIAEPRTYRLEVGLRF